MIICHCNVIKRDEIVEAIRELLAEDPSVSLEPQSIYKALSHRGKCCGCFPVVKSVVEMVLNNAISERELVARAGAPVELGSGLKDQNARQDNGH